MELLLVTGFLGSGKTTLIINLAEVLTAGGKKAAILVNEIGDIGIDDQLMRRLGMDVWELTGGCICCTLSGDLVRTLQKLDEKYEVDLVIVEPSGAAVPGMILSALPYYKGSGLGRIKTVAVVDPLRIELLYRMMTPLVAEQIRSADQILVTKADLASESDLERAKHIAAEINPGAAVSFVSGLALDFEDALKVIL